MSCWVTLLSDAAPKMVLELICPLRPNSCFVMAIFFLLFAFTLCNYSVLFPLAASGGGMGDMGGDTPHPGKGLCPLHSLRPRLRETPQTPAKDFVLCTPAFRKRGVRHYSTPAKDFVPAFCNDM